jgi:hypothetical protein
MSDLSNADDRMPMSDVAELAARLAAAIDEASAIVGQLKPKRPTLAQASEQAIKRATVEAIRRGPLQG